MGFTGGEELLFDRFRGVSRLSCNKSTVSPQRVYLAIAARTAEKIVSREREKNESIGEDPPSNAKVSRCGATCVLSHVPVGKVLN
jgi:hypothetical protein